MLPHAAKKTTGAIASRTWPTIIDEQKSAGQDQAGCLRRNHRLQFLPAAATIFSVYQGDLAVRPGDSPTHLRVVEE
ncbi:MAG: hypothetical protein P8X95_28660 [Anaerolineales bacterium]